MSNNANTGTNMICYNTLSERDLWVQLKADKNRLDNEIYANKIPLTLQETYKT